MVFSAIEAAQRAAGSRPAPTRPLAIPPPLQGHYGKGDFSAAPIQYALQTTNLYSDGDKVTIRPGYSATSGFPAAGFQAWDYEFGGERLAVFRTATGLSNEAGDATATVAFTGDVMADEISNRVVFAGGGVAPQMWDGAAFSVPSFVMPKDQAGATTETTALADLTGVVAHHDRLFFWSDSDPDGCQVYYLAGVGAITGDLIAFPLYALGNIKGQVKTCLSLSIDAGHGANDVLAIITTTGQIVVYEGLDPGDATDWRLWGRVPGTSEIINPNAIVRVATDAFVLMEAGVVSVRGLLSTGAQALAAPPSEALGADLGDVIAAGKGFRGWQMIVDPKGRFIVLNYPTAADTYAQWVFSYDGRGWFKWTLPARWWFQRAGELYFIDTGGVTRLFGAVGDLGAGITASWWTPWLPIAPQRRGALVRSCILELIVKTAPTVTITCLTDRHDSAADIADNQQTETLELRRTADGTWQSVEQDEILLSQTGRLVQMRLSLTATEAEWHGMTLNP